LVIGRSILAEPFQKIATGVFQQKEYAWLSGLLCSRAEALNRPAKMGGDFQLAPNLNATLRLPKSFRLRSTCYAANAVDNGYQVTPTFSQWATLC
jgi:hypothetical protein